jgi:hypothetical protein
MTKQHSHFSHSNGYYETVTSLHQLWHNSTSGVSTSLQKNSPDLKKMPKKKDRMAIEHEIAMLVFKQRGLTTDGMAWKEIQQEIFSLKEQRSGLVYN